MQFLLVLLALMPLIRGLRIQEVSDVTGRSFSSQIFLAIEAAQKQMPCGFPNLGIPPLAPLKTSHQEISINQDSFKAFGKIDNFRLDGLDDFDIVEMRVNAITSKLTFKFNWNHIHFNTSYEVSTSLEDLGFKRSGNAKLSLKNLTVWGVIKYSLGVLGGNVRLKSFDLYISLDKVFSDIEGLSKWKIINKKLNEIIEEWITLAINDNTENLSQYTNGYVVPLANEFIGDMTLSDLLGWIGGGGGGGGAEGEGEGAEDVEKVPCVPEES